MKGTDVEVGAGRACTSRAGRLRARPNKPNEKEVTLQHNSTQQHPTDCSHWTVLEWDWDGEPQALEAATYDEDEAKITTTEVE